ncbi:hypothetical protein GTA08_BOTSDO09507 [Neofusicoccum parvum]|uniref:Uncharacterized protein n=1 Tax=Neofusicoccum parvum TaxID=310453 RepID=A0ACB5RNC5_9PEZI|nr:hypothetical protein GTA08_BOTSDO09507 [Neofusicoccum parvum]GME34376.1 hypothetical protein GTA08_BOTSDO09507 [Neofusicoccum parvum]
MLLILFTILILLTIYGLQSMFSSGSLDGITYLTDLGFGAINVRTLITGWTVSQSAARGVWENTMIANAAQPLLSLLYFLYNGQLTAVYLGTEWDAYGVTAKGLRVSGVPRGAQRGTHFLQLPFRYSLPLAAASGLLHWLASQSLFAVSLVLDGGQSVFTCGYSPLALLCLLAALCLLPAVLLPVVLSRFGNGVPVAGSCSASIAASCHLPSLRGVAPDSVACAPLRWGVVHLQDAGRNRARHCRFRPCAVPFLDRQVTEPMPFERWRDTVQKVMQKEGSPACECCRRGELVP